MKKIITIISGVALVTSGVGSTVACSTNENNHTVEYNSSVGFSSEEINDLYINKDNIPLIFIIFCPPFSNEKSILIIEDKANDSSVIKIKNFYHIRNSIPNEKEKVIKAIKYSYKEETAQVENTKLKAQLVTNVDFIR